MQARLDRLVVHDRVHVRLDHVSCLAPSGFVRTAHLAAILQINARCVHVRSVRMQAHMHTVKLL